MSEERLDRIETILEAVATSHQNSLGRLDRLEGSYEASSQRLDRIEQIAASNATTIQAAGERLKEIEAITLSNARAIAANSNAIAELRQRDEVVLAEMRQNIADVVGMITTMGESFQQYADRAEQERAALSASLQSLINALTQRFSGNGHTE
jgi:type VII secretion effector (TIGR04197 family)